MSMTILLVFQLALRLSQDVCSTARKLDRDDRICLAVPHEDPCAGKIRHVIRNFMRKSSGKCDHTRQSERGSRSEE